MFKRAERGMCGYAFTALLGNLVAAGESAETVLWLDLNRAGIQVLAGQLRTAMGSRTQVVRSHY
jgi:hypothetical protein